jgi:hypothetical protein
MDVDKPSITMDQLNLACDVLRKNRVKPIDIDGGIGWLVWGLSDIDANDLLVLPRAGAVCGHGGWHRVIIK